MFEFLLDIACPRRRRGPAVYCAFPLPRKPTPAQRRDPAIGVLRPDRRSRCRPCPPAGDPPGARPPAARRSAAGPAVHAGRSAAGRSRYRPCRRGSRRSGRRNSSNHVHVQLGMPRDQGTHRRRDDQSGHEPDGERVRPARRGPPGGAERRRWPATAWRRRAAGVRPRSARWPVCRARKLGFQLVLQRPDLPGEHRLGDVERLGGPPEVQPLATATK